MLSSRLIVTNGSVLGPKRTRAGTTSVRLTEDGGSMTVEVDEEADGSVTGSLGNAGDAESDAGADDEDKDEDDEDDVKALTRMLEIC